MLYNRIRQRLGEVEARLGHLEGILDGIQARIDSIARAQNAERDDLVGRSDFRELELGMTRELEEFGRKIDQLGQAVVEGISNVERRENRIRATIGRARKELEAHGLESPAVEAEYRDLQAVDGARGATGGVPVVREDVADSRDRFAAFPGSFDGPFLEVG